VLFGFLLPASGIRYLLVRLDSKSASMNLSSYFQTSSLKTFYFQSAYPIFSYPPCLEYLCPRALILLRLWRYTSHVLVTYFTYTFTRDESDELLSLDDTLGVGHSQ